MSEEKTVRISLRAYDTIALHATKYASSDVPQADWKIVHGFLCGEIQGEDTIVYDAVPMAHGSYDSVELDGEDYVNSASLDSLLAELGYFIVGWYHSHPGKGLFLHKEDKKSQLSYQGPNPKALALVFDHTKKDSTSQGIEVYSLDNPDQGVESGYHAIKWKIEPELDKVKLEGQILDELRGKELE